MATESPNQEATIKTRIPSLSDSDMQKSQETNSDKTLDVRLQSATMPHPEKSTLSTPRKRFWSFRRAGLRPEFNPKTLADFRVTDWDPTRLLMELYRTQNSHFHRSRLRKEGMLETLNLGQTRPGFFRRYKAKYLFVSDSTLTCFQSQPADVSHSKPKIKVLLPSRDSEADAGTDETGNDLMDSVRWQEGSSVVQVRDRLSNKWFTCRATSDEEAGEWFDTIRQEIYNPSFVKNQMTLHFEAHPEEMADLVMVVGSSSVRAGFSQHQEGGPLIYFPSVVLHTEEAEVSNEFSWGFEAVHPSARSRARSLLKEGFRYSQDLQQNVFRPLHLSSLLYYVLCDLMRLRDMRRIRLLLSLPHVWKGYTEDVCHVILGELNLGALALVPGNILSLYHDSTSLTALVVRLGGGMEIVPIVDGVVLESAAQRNPELGGHLIDAMLMDLLAKLNIRTSSTVESFLWRLVKERHAFVSLDPEQDLIKAEQDPQSLERFVDLSEFQPPNNAHSKFRLVAERFQCAEVLFNPALSGKDFSSVPQYIAQVLERVDIDLRRDLAKRILLVGGTSLLPQLAERLHKEVSLILSQHGERRGFQLGINTMTDREHAAYLGGCQLIGDETYEPILRKEWIHLSEWQRDQEIHV